MTRSRLAARLSGTTCRTLAVVGTALCLIALSAPAAAAGRAWGEADALPLATDAAGAAVAPARTAAPSLAHIGAENLVGDPAGDTFGAGPVFHDVVQFGAFIDDEFGDVLFFLQTVDPFSAGDSGATDALVGYIDIDTDQDGATGDVPFTDGFGGNTGMGNEFYIDLFSYDGGTGTADLVDDVNDVVVGQVPMAFLGDVLIAAAPLALLDDDGFLDAAAVIGTVPEPTDLVPNNGAVSSSVLPPLLTGGRFAVEIGWRDFVGNTGPGRLAVRSDNSANFWFFRSSNWEVLLKVLNGCPVNNHYWVFFAATTNVEFEITVTDIDTDEVARYGNELGKPADAVTDTQAFATCP